MSLTRFQNGSDDNIRSARADQTHILPVCERGEDSCALIEQGDVHSGIRLDLIQKGMVAGQICLTLVQMIGSITDQTVVAGIKGIEHRHQITGDI